MTKTLIRSILIVVAHVQQKRTDQSNSKGSHIFVGTDGIVALTKHTIRHGDNLCTLSQANCLRRLLSCDEALASIIGRLSGQPSSCCRIQTKSSHRASFSTVSPSSRSPESRLFTGLSTDRDSLADFITHERVLRYARCMSRHFCFLLPSLASSRHKTLLLIPPDPLSRAVPLPVA